MGCGGTKVEDGADEPSAVQIKSQPQPVVQAVPVPLPRPDSVPVDLPKPIPLPKPVVVAEIPKPVVVAEIPKPVVAEIPKPVVAEIPKPVVAEILKPVVVEPLPKPIPPSPRKMAESELADSLILSDLPTILNKFRNKKFELLWRGSRDGFSAEAFHSLCDDRPNTLNIILDTHGNFFGGFTTVPLEYSFITKTDPTLSIFHFTIKNEYDAPPAIFPVKKDKKDYAVFCYARYGPSFGFPDASDLRIADNCNQENARRTNYAGAFGGAYVNNTKMNWKIGENCFLAGNPFFVVKEIEVFEIPL
jgi:hypothetical protein